MLGHDGPPTGLITRNLLTDEQLDRCPVRTVQLAIEARSRASTEFLRYADTYYPQWKQGHLIERGGVGEQPARYLELIGMFHEVEDLVETKLIEITRQRPTSSE